MPIAFTWTGKQQAERVARIRWQCYASRGSDEPAMRDRLAHGREGDADICIASRDGVDVGTATSLSLHMHVRGKRVPCQGVAWVGTSKAHRRRVGNERGIASQLMHELLDKARERRETISALMPFRVSFYEHFGYGVMERQNVWTIPLTTLPRTDAPGWRFGTPDDATAMVACRARQALTGQCDIETDETGMRHWRRAYADGTQLFVNDEAGQITAYAWLGQADDAGRAVAVVQRAAWDSPAAFRSLLGLLGSLRDQCSFARMTLPVDLPVNWLLSERQAPHRPVDHPAPACQMITRMQCRVLDHAGFLSGQKLTTDAPGDAVVRIAECEGTTSTVALRFAQRRIEAEPTTREPDIETNDLTWAALACGDLRATTAAQIGLIKVHRAQAALALDALAAGAAPFCFEYF